MCAPPPLFWQHNTNIAINSFSHQSSTFKVQCAFVVSSWDFHAPNKTLQYFFGTQEKLTIIVTSSMEEYSGSPLKIQSLLDQGAKAPS